MVKLPTEKQRRIVKAKIQGQKQRDIANVEYPQASQESKDVLVSRELHKPHVAKYLDKELSVMLEQQNVTKSQYIQNIGLAMTADKQDQFTGEVRPDIGARLQGNKMAERFIKFDEPSHSEPMDLSNMDTMEMTKVLFKRQT